VKITVSNAFSQSRQFYRVRLVPEQELSGLRRQSLLGFAGEKRVAVVSSKLNRGGVR
jgi:hypothetical protein